MRNKFNRFLALSRKAFGGISYISTVFFKFGCTLVLMALAAVYILCDREVSAGGVGVELYYAPMLDYILTALLIFWGGTFLIDIAEKEITAGK